MGIQALLVAVHFIAFTILPSDFLCDHGVLQDILSPGPLCHMYVTCLMLVLGKKAWTEIYTIQILASVAPLCGREPFSVTIYFLSKGLSDLLSDLSPNHSVSFLSPEEI